MNFNKMEVTDLLTDESFINYCNKSSPADIAFWENYIKENPQYQRVVEHAREKYITLFNELANADLEVQLADLKNKMIEKQPNLQNYPGDTIITSKPTLVSWIYRLSAAAAVLIVAVYFIVTYSGTGDTAGTKTYVANYGERKNIQLPDGSEVTLNAGSTIKIKGDFGKDFRDVYLEGEAFFDVKHNAKIPFIVHTLAMDVKALGTAFNVRAYLNEQLTETSLIKGLVEVTLIENQHSKMLLYPNHKVMWDHKLTTTDTNTSPSNNTKPVETDRFTKKLVTTDDGDIREIAWKENKLIFEDQLFSDIATYLERWYGVQINFEDDTLKGYRFTGTYEKEDLNTVLEFLKESRNFHYRIVKGEPLIINLSK